MPEAPLNRHTLRPIVPRVTTPMPTGGRPLYMTRHLRSNTGRPALVNSVYLHRNIKQMLFPVTDLRAMVTGLFLRCRNGY